MTREELNKVKQSEIINEERRAKRKKFVLLSLKVIFILIVVFMTFYLLNTYIFTKKMIVKERRIVDEKIPENFNGIKIVQFSDLHYGSTIFIDDVKNLVKLINSRNPDIVIFTGDLIDKNYKISSKEREKLIKELSKVKANIGKYAVDGDEDATYADIYATVIKQANFINISNSYDLIYDEENVPIIIIGVSSLLSEKYNIDDAFSYFNDSTSNNDLYRIVVFHEPDLADYILEKEKANLLLAGHSHNGNIKLPFIDGLIKYDGAKKYYDAEYHIGEASLFISSGIGTNGSGVRMFCHPSINFFRLSNK